MATTLKPSDPRVIMETTDGRKVNINVNDADSIASLKEKGFSIVGDYQSGEGVSNYTGSDKNYVADVAKVMGKTTTTTPTAVDYSALTGQISDSRAQAQSAYDSAAKSIQSIYSNRLSSQTAQIDEATGQAVSDYEAQQETASQTAQDSRSNQDVTTARQIQRQNQVAAQKGLSYSGGAASDIMGAQASGQQAKTAYTTQEQNVISSLKRAIADAQRSGSLQKIAAEADLKSEETQALMTAQSNQDQLALQREQLAMQQAGLTGMYQGQQTLDSKISEASLTGSYNGQKTLDTQLAEAGLTGSYGGVETLAAKQWRESMGLDREQFEVQTQQWNQEFDQMVSEAKSNQSLNWAKLQADKDATAQSNALRAGELELDRNKYEWSIDPSNPDNIVDKVAKEFDFSTSGKRVYDNALNMIKDLKQANEYGVLEGKYTTEDIVNYIWKQDLSQEEIDNILVMVPGL